MIDVSDLIDAVRERPDRTLAGPPPELGRQLDLVRSALLHCPEPPDRAARLVWQRDTRWNQLRLSHALTIGSAAQCDVVVDCPFVSAEHCLLRRSEGDWTVEDQNSTNGLYVNRVRTRNAILKDGDVLQVGSAAIVFFAAEDAP